MKKAKRLLGLILAVIMAISLIPMTAMAHERLEDIEIEFFTAIVGSQNLPPEWQSPPIVGGDVTLEDRLDWLARRLDLVRSGEFPGVYPEDRITVTTWHRLMLASLPIDEARLQDFLAETTNIDFSHTNVTSVARTIRDNANARTDAELAQAAARYLRDAFARDGASRVVSDVIASEALAPDSYPRTVEAGCTHYTVSLVAILRYWGIPTGIASIRVGRSPSGEIVRQPYRVLSFQTDIIGRGSNHTAAVAFLDGEWKIVDAAIRFADGNFIHTATEYDFGLIVDIASVAAGRFNWSTNRPGLQRPDPTINVVHDLNARDITFARASHEIYVNGTRLNHAFAVAVEGDVFIDFGDFAQGLTRYSDRNLGFMINQRDYANLPAHMQTPRWGLTPRFLLLPRLEHIPLGSELTVRSLPEVSGPHFRAERSELLHSIHGAWTRIDGITIHPNATLRAPAYSFTNIAELCRIMNIHVSVESNAIRIDTTRAFAGAAVTTPPVTTTQTTAPNLSTASNWAHDSINEAFGLGLIPQNLQSNYTANTTRAEFAALAVALYETVTGREIAGRMQFNDTNDVNVQKMGYLGVVTGVGGGNFAPNNTLTREQAAVMLARLAYAIGQPLPPSAPTFADNAQISGWAVDGVGQMQASGIMGGVGNNQFSPSGSYTREQSIVTMLRLFDLLS